MARRRTGSTTIYAASLLLHAGVALAVTRIEKKEVREPTTVTVHEVKRKPPTPAEPPPPPPPPPPPTPAPKQPRTAPKAKAPEVKQPAPEPAPVQQAPAQQAPVADFGIAMTGAVGAGGIAVPVGNSTRVAPVRTVKAAPPKALVKPKAEESCLEPLVKPKPISTPQPAYADRAREAGIQGKVRVELTVDASGAVVAARVIESLGYGLDEAALEAAKTWRFEPATRCGRPTSTTFVVGIRFTL